MSGAGGAMVKDCITNFSYCQENLNVTMPDNPRTLSRMIGAADPMGLMIWNINRSGRVSNVTSYLVYSV